MEANSSTFFVDAYINRYLSAVSVAIILYDHLITFDEEYKRVWTNAKTHRTEGMIWKAAYLICKYVSDCMLVFTAYILSGGGELNLATCRAWIWCFMLLGYCFIAFTQMLVGHHIHALWEHRESVKRTIFGVFIVFALGTGVLAVLACRELQFDIIYLDFARSCFFQKKSVFVTLSISLMVAFDLFLVLMAISNALDTPRMRNGEILARLNRDGGLYFLSLLGEVFVVGETWGAESSTPMLFLTVLLFVALCLIIWGRLMTSYMLLPPTWAFSSVITSRLYYRVNKSKKEILRRGEREIGVLSGGKSVDYHKGGSQ